MYIFFQRFQKYLNFDLHYVIHNGFWLLSEKIVLTAKGLIVLYIFANYVDQTTFGKQQFLFTLVGLLSIFTIPGLTSAIVNSVANGKEGILRKATKKIFTRSLIGSLLLAAYGGYAAFILKDGQVVILSSILALSFPSYAAMSLLRAYYIGKEQFKYLAKMTIGTEVGLLILFLPVSFITPTLFWLVVVTIVAPGIIYSVILLRLLKKISQTAEVDVENIVFGGKLSNSHIITIISGYVDKALVGTLLGFSPLAVLSVAQSIPEQLRSVVVSLSLLIFPKLSKYSEQQETHYKVRNLFIWGTLFLLVIFLLYVYSASFLFSLLFPKFSNQTILLSIIIMSSVVLSPIIILDNYFRARKMYAVINFHAMLSCGFMIGLVLLLTPLYGVIGAVMGKVLSLLIGWTYMLYKFLDMK